MKDLLSTDLLNLGRHMVKWFDKYGEAYEANRLEDGFEIKELK